MAGFTSEAISNYLASNPGMTDAQIASAMDQYGVSAGQVAEATGVPLADVQSRYDTAAAQNQGISSLINQAYGSIGVTAPDTEGFNYWTNKLQTGALSPDDFQRTFLTAASGVTDPQYAANVKAAKDLLTSNLVTSAYQQYLGRAPEAGIVEQWQTVNPQLQDIQKALEQSEEYQLRLANARIEDVTKAYQDILGRAPDDPGLQYFTGKMSTGDITSQNLYDTLARSAQGLEDRIAAQRYLGQEIWAPTEFLQGTSGVGYDEIINYINQFVEDPVKIAQRAKQFGIDASEILQAKQARGEANLPTLEQIQDYLRQGEAGFANRFAGITQDIFGSPEEIEVLANAVYNQNKARIINDPNLTPEQKRLALEQTRDDFISKTYGLEAYGSTSLEDIEKSLRESGANRLQEAYRLGNIASEYLGYSKDDAQALINKALAGKGLSDPEQKIFDTLLQQHGVSSKSQNDLLTYAAMTNPDAPIFKKNPTLLTLYTPLPGVIEKTSDTKWGGGSGQYGYYEGAPILNADIAKSIVGEHGSTRNLNAGMSYSDIAKTLGMDFASHAETTMFKAGRSIVGVDFDKQYIKDMADLERGLNNGSILRNVDPETGAVSYLKKVDLPSVSVFGDEYYNYSYQPISAPTLPGSSLFSGYANAPQTMSEVQDKLTSAAKTLGISTENKTLDRLFDEITDKTTGLYQIVGNSSAIDREAYPDAKNHINAIYKQVSNKLLPVDVNFFHADAPKKRGFGPIGGFVGDMLSGIASIPGIAELAVVASGGQLAPYYPAIKAVQVGGLTGDLDEGLKAGAKAWIVQQGVAMADQAIGGYLIDAGITDIDMVNTLSSIGSNVAANMGLAALSGQDISDAGIASLVASAVGEATKGAVGKAGIPPQYQAAVTQILADAILKNDLQKSLSRIALKEVTKGVKDVAKTAKEVGKEKVAA